MNGRPAACLPEGKDFSDQDPTLRINSRSCFGEVLREEFLLMEGLDLKQRLGPEAKTRA